MMACAFAGPMPDSATSSSLVAVLRLSAAQASCDASPMAMASNARILKTSFGRMEARRVAPADAAGVRRARAPSLRTRSRRRNQTFDVARDALLDALHRRREARRTQPRQVGLRKALVLADERRGHRDVADGAFALQLVERARRLAGAMAQRVDRSKRHRVERRRNAGAEVEDPRALAMVAEPQVRVDDVVDVDEVAALLAVGIAAGSGEQRNAAIALVLIEQVPGHRGHPALVRLARAVDVEVAKARDLRGALAKEPAHVRVEQRLRIAVYVERRLVLALLAKHRRAPVYSRARCIEERDVVVLAMLEQPHRIAVVVAHHVPAVARHRVRAGAFVEHDVEVVVEVAIHDAEQEFVLVDVIGNVAIGEVAKLVALRQVVDGDDVALAALVERLHEIRADEAGRAGHHRVHARPSFMSPLPAEAHARRTARAALWRTAIRSRPCPPPAPRRRQAALRPTARHRCRRRPAAPTKDPR